MQTVQISSQTSMIAYYTCNKLFNPFFCLANLKIQKCHHVYFEFWIKNVIFTLVNHFPHRIIFRYGFSIEIFRHIQTCLQQVQMNRLALLVTLMILLACHTVTGAPLKAMLYCYLPSVNKIDPMPEYRKLAEMINAKLQNESINVVVDVCDPGKNGNGQYLYDPDKINKLFDDHDILEVDVSYLWAITVPLLKFSRNDIQYYDRVYPFEWKPTSRTQNGNQVIVGSPGLMCSDFMETRIQKGQSENTLGIGYLLSIFGNLFGNLFKNKQNEDYQQITYANFNPDDAFGLVTYYLNAYISGGPGRDLDNMDYSKVDGPTIAMVADFLKNCQVNQQSFDYKNNLCISFNKENPFLPTSYATTIGFSENLFNFLNAGIPKENIKIEHIRRPTELKLFYVDSFIAKSTADRETVLKFYEFMLRDEILDLYVQGSYTNSPKTTYLLPPTKAYFDNLVKTDPLYSSIYHSAFAYADFPQLPIYQDSFARNLYQFAKMIDDALRNYKQSPNEL